MRRVIGFFAPHTELAELAGVSSDAIRYYEKEGLLPEPSRSPSGYREFDADLAERLRLLRSGDTLLTRVTRRRTSYATFFATSVAGPAISAAARGLRLSHSARSGGTDKGMRGPHQGALARGPTSP
jgi:hypothetical protein